MVAYWASARLGLAQLGAGPDWPLLGLALGTGGAAMVLWPRYDPSRWARGAAGELATAALLEHLPGRQWVVLHDLALPGSRANVDHLVIGPTGVWVVDTKAYRARLDVRWRQRSCWERPALNSSRPLGGRASLDCARRRSSADRGGPCERPAPSRQAL